MNLHQERGLRCALRLSMGIQPHGCCFDACVLCLRLLVASVAGSPAGGRVGVFLTLDLVVRCSSTKWCRDRVLVSWDPLWVSSSLYSLAFGKPLDLPRSRLWIRFSSSHFWSLIHWRYLSGVLPASVVDCCLSSLRAGVCSHLWQRRVPAWVLLVAWLPLPRVWRSAPSYIPLMRCASTGSPVIPGLSALCIDRFSGHSWPIIPCHRQSGGRATPKLKEETTQWLLVYVLGTSDSLPRSSSGVRSNLWFLV